MEQTPIDIRTDAEAADVLATNFSSTELRALASNAGVSRERGDTKRRTAERIVAQDPALAARAIDNDREVAMNASAFREAREVGADRISLGEAIERARHDKTRRKLRSLKRALAGLPSYEAKVEWEYGGEVRDGGRSTQKAGYRPGLTSVIAKRAEDAEDVHWLLNERVHVLLTPHGRCTLFEVGDTRYIDRDTPNPGTRWRTALSRVERLYEP